TCSPTGRWCFRSRRSRAWSRTWEASDAAAGIDSQAPDHREGDPLEGRVEHGLLRGRGHGEQDRGRQGGPEALRGQGGRRPRRQPAGEVEAHGPVRRPAQGLEKGLRPARAGSEDRVLRGRVMAVKKYKPTSAGRRFQTMHDFSELSSVRPEKSLTVGL